MRGDRRAQTGLHGAAQRLLRAGPGVVLALAVACTGSVPEGPEGGPRTSPSPPGPIGQEGPEPFILTVVVAEQDLGGYLDGIRMAVGEVNEAGGVARRELAIEVRDTVAAGLERTGAAALLVVGRGTTVEEHREAIEEGGGPLFLLHGDLYSSRSLFRQVFQTAPPALWQSRVLARYAARDRRHGSVALLHDQGIDGERARDAAVEAFTRQGVELDPIVGMDEPGPRLRAALREPDALVVAGGRTVAHSAIRSAAGLDDPPQLLLPSDVLAAEVPAGLPEPPEGTVAPAPYTWAGWAEPIPRVRRFRDRFELSFGRTPRAAEQEGYDAVRVVADALEQTGGRSGSPLIRALETFRPAGPTYSSLPATLGPDDHLFTNEVQLGLFEVAGADQDVEPWVDGVPWRPLIRSFTYDGERTVFLERDRRVFFPFWREGRPSPRFHRSRYGIVTRAADDRGVERGQ